MQIRGVLPKLRLLGSLCARRLPFQVLGLHPVQPLQLRAGTGAASSAATKVKMNPRWQDLQRIGATKCGSGDSSWAELAESASSRSRPRDFSTAASVAIAPSSLLEMTDLNQLLSHRSRLHRVRLLVELVALLLVFGFNDTAFELDGWRDLAGSDGKLVGHNQNFLDGFKVCQLFVHVFDNAAVEIPHFRCRHQVLVRLESHSIRVSPIFEQRQVRRKDNGSVLTAVSNDNSLRHQRVGPQTVLHQDPESTRL